MDPSVEMECRRTKVDEVAVEERRSVSEPSEEKKEGERAYNSTTLAKSGADMKPKLTISKSVATSSLISYSPVLKYDSAVASESYTDGTKPPPTPLSCSVVSPLFLGPVATCARIASGFVMSPPRFVSADVSATESLAISSSASSTSSPCELPSEPSFCSSRASETETRRSGGETRVGGGGGIALLVLATGGE